MKICYSGTCVEVQETAMKVRLERKKELVTTPGGEPIYVDMGRQPIRVDVEGIISAEAGRQLVTWCQNAVEVTVQDAPSMFPTQVSSWVLEVADIEGIKGSPGYSNAKLILVEVTSYTYIFPS
ncbi:MAG: hypothetical protein DRG33_04575 [Deltaproteobacteria bacterium]|nr:MAG: hypothetical protein DRG33_04575 [Deltaproteobacteria bacterium]